MKLNYKRTILVGFAFFLISAFWVAYDAIIPLALTNHFGLEQDVSGAIMSLDNVLAVFMLPLFGSLSDKVSSRYGKRTPFVVIGTVVSIIAFIGLTFVDNYQIAKIAEAGIPELRAAADALMMEGERLGDAAMIAEAQAQLAQINADTAAITAQYWGVIVAFIGVLLVTLIAMATFRSPAVALMPDITIKPLRSKGNAIINLMGTAGGMIILVLGMAFGTSQNLYMRYTGYVVAVCGVMAAALAIFMFTVKENKWANDMLNDTERFGLKEDSDDRESTGKTETKKLSKEERTSLILLLASVALWYIGYNSITSKYSVYATNVLHFDYNITLVVAQAAAVIAFIPVGMLASKIGRRRSILIGVAVLTIAFASATFINSASSPILMYAVFIAAGIGWATINVNSFPMVVELAKGGDVGKYTGYYYTASMAAQIVTPILSGTLVKHFGWGIFFPYAAVAVACAMVTMFFVKHGDSEPEMTSALEALGGADD